MGTEIDQDFPKAQKIWDKDLIVQTMNPQALLDWSMSEIKASMESKVKDTLDAKKIEIKNDKGWVVA